MLRVIENRFNKLYLEFMSYNLELLNDFNLLFQSNKPLLHKTKSEVQKLLKTVCSNFIQTHYIRNEKNLFTFDHTDPRKFLPIENIYLGIQATESFTDLQKNSNVLKKDIDIFLKNCLNFYLELVTDIKKRFVFEDPLFDLIRVVDPKFAYSYEIKTLQHVLERFPVLCNFVDKQLLDNEWKKHALLDFNELEFNFTEDADDYWRQILKLKNSAGMNIFPNLKIVINFLLILPFSNASVERIFSDLKNIKTHNRNSLNTHTIRALILTKQGIDNVINFEPDKKLLNANIWTKDK